MCVCVLPWACGVSVLCAVFECESSLIRVFWLCVCKYDEISFVTHSSVYDDVSRGRNQCVHLF